MVVTLKYAIFKTRLKIPKNPRDHPGDPSGIESHMHLTAYKMKAFVVKCVTETYNMDITKKELDYIRSFNGHRAPCNVTFDSKKGKHSKVPAVANWTDVTPEVASKLEAEGWDGHKHFIFLTGESTGQFVIDIDRKNLDRADHNDKIDGLEFFEDWCGQASNPDTFTTKTIGGGYHKVYTMCDELKESIKSGQLRPDVLVDILYNKRGFVFGEGYNIVNKMAPQKPPQYIINFITINQNNSINNSTVQNSTIGGNTAGIGAEAVYHLQSRGTGQAGSKNSINVAQIAYRASRVNSVIGTDVDWTIAQLDDTCYKLIPKSTRCCVNTDHQHSDVEHSSLYVRKSSVTANCFSHGTKQIIGAQSRSLREIFFKFESADTAMAKVVGLVLSKAESEGLVRDNGFVLKKYEPIASYEEFVQNVLTDNPALAEQPKRFNDMMLYMNKVDSIRFPFVKRNRKYIGFSNGLLDLINGELVGNDVLKSGEVPRHYIDQPFCTDDLDTPLFDKIVRHQLENDEIYTYMLAFIGRLFYDVGKYDKLAVVPFVIGDTNTGKSTLINIIRSMFAPGSVGSLDSKHETIFGLSSLYDKELIVAQEVNNKMADQLSSDAFKMMVCGESISISRKHTKSLQADWTVPLFMCGNQHLNYTDDRGSISRRLAIFKFERYVAEVDGSLEEQIVKHELSKVLTKCLMAYRLLLDYACETGFWNTCPSYFKENKDDMSESTDYIYMFLSLGPEDNVWGDRCVYFLKKKDSSMLMEHFKVKFFNWLKFKHQNVKYKWTCDYSAFKRKGFEISRTKVCKACGQKASVDCCIMSGHGNRTTRTIIENIVCVEECT